MIKSSHEARPIDNAEAEMGIFSDSGLSEVQSTENLLVNLTGTKPILAVQASHTNGNQIVLAQAAVVPVDAQEIAQVDSVVTDQAEDEFAAVDSPPGKVFTPLGSVLGLSVAAGALGLVFASDNGSSSVVAGTSLSPVNPNEDPGGETGQAGDTGATGATGETGATGDPGVVAVNVNQLVAQASTLLMPAVTGVETLLVSAADALAGSGGNLPEIPGVSAEYGGNFADAVVGLIGSAGISVETLAGALAGAPAAPGAPPAAPGESFQAFVDGLDELGAEVAGSFGNADPAGGLTTALDVLAAGLTVAGEEVAAGVAAFAEAIEAGAGQIPDGGLPQDSPFADADAQLAAAISSGFDQLIETYETVITEVTNTLPEEVAAVIQDSGMQIGDGHEMVADQLVAEINMGIVGQEDIDMLQVNEIPSGLPIEGQNQVLGLLDSVVTAITTQNPNPFTEQLGGLGLL